MGKLVFTDKQVIVGGVIYPANTPFEAKGKLAEELLSKGAKEVKENSAVVEAKPQGEVATEAIKKVSETETKAKPRTTAKTKRG